MDQSDGGETVPCGSCCTGTIASDAYAGNTDRKGELKIHIPYAIGTWGCVRPEKAWRPYSTGFPSKTGWSRTGHSAKSRKAQKTRVVFTH